MRPAASRSVNWPRARGGSSARSGLDLLVVDYLQLLQGSSHRASEDRVHEITEITTRLKALAKELNIPILALSQLSRQVEGRDDKRPQLSDLRESGSIEQDADVVMFVFREEYYHQMRKPTEAKREKFAEWLAEGERVEGKAEVIIGKQRHGPTGTVELQFDAAVTRFANLDTAHRPSLSRPPAAARRTPLTNPLYQHARAGHNPAMALAEVLPEPISTSPASETGGTLMIDLNAIVSNWRALARLIRTAECAAVVKANAYGLGLEAVGARLAQAGCKTFFVADLAEARRLRSRATDAAIYVLNGFWPDAGPSFIEIGARPVINSTTELAEWDAFVTEHNWRGGAALHVDTGMNRLGIPADEAMALAPRVQTDNHGITLVMSHLACAEIGDHPLNTSQIQLFKEIRSVFRGVPASLANSSGIFLGNPAYYDLARPGAALYGINPLPGRPNPMQSVVELSGRILQVRKVDRGGTVGYGASWTAKRPSRIAVVAIGYADGLPRVLSGIEPTRHGVAVIAGKQCPFVGRISMDLICIDITDLPDGTGHRGDIATFIGEGISIDDVAARAGTIGYEILTRLGPRCRLVYRGA